MSKDLQKKVPESVKENVQYVMAFGLIATMLLVAQFPVFVVFFFGIFAFFLWKTFSQPARSGTREIFEFYLSANEILRDDERRWFGFEVQEIVNRGERILQLMNGAPPLMYFALGALYHKIGDYKSAVNHLSYVVENEYADETTYQHPSAELRSYVRILRKIEREPAEAPQTSAAIRALERARRNRGKTLLENSREGLSEARRKKREIAAQQKHRKNELPAEGESIVPDDENPPIDRANHAVKQTVKSLFDGQNGHYSNDKDAKKQNENAAGNRKSISEVLHDIYDGK